MGVWLQGWRRNREMRRGRKMTKARRHVWKRKEEQESKCLERQQDRLGEEGKR